MSHCMHGLSGIYLSVSAIAKEKKRGYHENIPTKRERAESAMGKFDGMLLLSDYDNTLLYTEEALRDGSPRPPMSQRNLDGIHRWMAEGGRFAVATGRALEAFRRHAHEVPMNAPIIVDNGGAIYDLERGEYVVKNFLPDVAPTHIAAIAERFPQVAVELYPDANFVQVLRPTAWNARHAKLTGARYEEISCIDPEKVPRPLVKALFVGPKEELDTLRAEMVREGLTEYYELIFSSGELLELTAKGANKGEMARKLRDLCGCHTLLCAGDHLNDLPMLSAANRAFCPANAVPEVLSSGATVVCHCLEGSIGEIVERMEKER